MKKENKDYLKFMESTIDEIIGKDETIINKSNEIISLNEIIKKQTKTITKYKNENKKLKEITKEKIKEIIKK